MDSFQSLFGKRVIIMNLIFRAPVFFFFFFFKCTELEKTNAT